MTGIEWYRFRNLVICKVTRLLQGQELGFTGVLVTCHHEISLFRFAVQLLYTTFRSQRRAEGRSIKWVSAKRSSEYRISYASRSYCRVNAHAVSTSIKLGMGRHSERCSRFALQNIAEKVQLVGIHLHMHIGSQLTYRVSYLAVRPQPWKSLFCIARDEP